MYERFIKRIRHLVLERRYIVTLHAYDETSADDLSIWDVESALLNGQIVERQRDRQTTEHKLRINGMALDDTKIEVIVKFGPTGKLIIITVYKT